MLLKIEVFFFFISIGRTDKYLTFLLHMTNSKYQQMRSNSITKAEFTGRSDMKYIKEYKNNQELNDSLCRFWPWWSQRFTDQSFQLRLHFKCQIIHVGCRKISEFEKYIFNKEKYFQETLSTATYTWMMCLSLKVQNESNGKKQTQILWRLLGTASRAVKNTPLFSVNTLRCSRTKFKPRQHILRINSGIIM